MATKYILTNTSQLTADKAYHFVKGFRGSAAANTTSTIDFSLPYEGWVNGGQLIIEDGNRGDSLDVKVIDKDNVLGLGANTVLRILADSYYVSSAPDVQIEWRHNLLTYIPAGLYLRVVYRNTSLLTLVRVVINLNLFLPTDVVQ